MEDSYKYPPFSALEEPVWIPSSRISLSKVEQYLETCEKIRFKSDTEKKFQADELIGVTKPPHSEAAVVFDDENALYALFCANYDVHEAIKKTPFEWSNIESVNGPRLTYKQPWKHFTIEECEQFEEGIRKYGKNFHEISNKIVRILIFF